MKAKLKTNAKDQDCVEPKAKPVLRGAVNSELAVTPEDCVKAKVTFQADLLQHV